VTRPSCPRWAREEIFEREGKKEKQEKQEEEEGGKQRRNKQTRDGGRREAGHTLFFPCPENSPYQCGFFWSFHFVFLSLLLKVPVAADGDWHVVHLVTVAGALLGLGPH
jgi:hypothetical protein